MQPDIPGYRIIRELGEGGMAVVYLAVQELFERLVALKVMRTTSSADQDFALRFVREARIIGALNHPNIVPVYEVGESQGQYFFSMEFLPDEDLANRIEIGIPLEKVIYITSQLARALDYAHRHGVIHRDVKPDNILFRNSGEAVLTDFGIATDLNDNGKLTIVESVVGSPRYMSPEQTRAADIDSRSDIFSLGVIMYEMVTGLHPFNGVNTATIALQQIENIPLTLPTEGKILQPILNKMVALSPADRFATALTLADEIDKVGARAGFDPMRGFKSSTAERIEEKPTIVIDRNQASALRREAEPDSAGWRKRVPQRASSYLLIIMAVLLLGLALLWLPTGQSPTDTAEQHADATNPPNMAPGTGPATGKPLASDNNGGAAAVGADNNGQLAPGYYLFEPGKPAKTPFPQAERQEILTPVPQEVYLYSDLAAGSAEITLAEFAARYPKSVFTEILMIKAGDDNLLTNVIDRARAGEEAALLILSELTDSGWSVAQDPEEALGFARQSARFDYALGHYQVATILMQTDGRAEQEALLHLKKAINGGFFLAMTTLADIYSNQGGIESETRALQLYRRAADLGDREAMFKAGKIILAQENTSGTTFEALTYLNRAAALGHMGAESLLEQSIQDRDSLLRTN